MISWFSPGRIEVLGKHTDYAGGRSLLAALDRGVTVTVRPAESGIQARTSALPGTVDVSRDELEPGHWGRYVQTTVSRLTRNFGELAPCSLDVTSTLPLASGMSSSSALVVASAMALARYNGFDESEAWTAEVYDPETLASYLACIENGSSFGALDGDRGVGTFGGSEDHTAMACCREGHVSQFSYGPVRREADVAVPEELTFVVATSGVLAEKTGAAREAYNHSSLQAREIVRRWNVAGGREDVNIAQAIASADDALERLSALVRGDEALLLRLRHFVKESDVLVPAAGRALAAGNLTALGEVCDESQRVAGAWLGNQIPETEYLAASARKAGAYAASAFGAGYGGGVWALVNRSDAEAFGSSWLGGYLRAYPQHAATASVLTSRPSGPTHEVGVEG